VNDGHGGGSRFFSVDRTLAFSVIMSIHKAAKRKAP
jgi:hypothetical protein